jgi:hypothetical protein
MMLISFDLKRKHVPWQHFGQWKHLLLPVWRHASTNAATISRVKATYL